VTEEPTEPAEPAEPAADPNIGRVLENKYEITRALGAGGIGAVYEVHHKLIDRRFALKLLHPEYARDEEVLERFRREATSTTAIGHPHILEITDMGSTPEGEVFMVMELLHGHDLEVELKQQGALSTELACHIALQILSALEATHIKGIVHRDLKPANVFLIERGGNQQFVKLVDFGISKVRASEEDQTKGLTRTGMLLGTPAYMSPEQAMGSSDITGSSDLYAVGVILYEMLTGQTPFAAESYVTLLMKILQDEVPDPLSLRPDLDSELAAIVLRSMAKQVPDRFADAAEFREALTPYSPETQIPGTETLGPSLYEHQSGQYPEAAGIPPGSSPSVGRGTTPLALTEAVPPRRPGKGLVLGLGLGGLAVIAIAAVSLVLVLGGTPDEPVAAVPVTAAPVAPPPAAAAPVPPVPSAPAPAVEAPPPTPAPAAETKMVALKLKVDPPYAEVMIDGQKIGRGSRELQLAADDEPHRIEVSADGFVPQTHQVVLQADQTLDCDLERIGGAKRGRAGRKGGRPAAPPAAASAPEPEPAPKPKPKPKPGKREIDQEEPW
jgi:serine/threonine-protein kinase